MRTLRQIQFDLESLTASTRRWFWTRLRTRCSRAVRWKALHSHNPLPPARMRRMRSSLPPRCSAVIFDGFGRIFQHFLGAWTTWRCSQESFTALLIKSKVDNIDRYCLIDRYRSLDVKTALRPSYSSNSPFEKITTLSGDRKCWSKCEALRSGGRRKHGRTHRQIHRWTGGWTFCRLHFKLNNFQSKMDAVENEMNTFQLLLGTFCEGLDKFSIENLFWFSLKF